MRYIIDIDGVIGTKLHWDIGEQYLRAKSTFSSIPVNVEVINKINLMYDSGNTIVLHTSRLWHDFEVTVEWLKLYNVKYHTLVMAKPLGDFYIDDRNMSVSEFLNAKN